VSSVEVNNTKSERSTASEIHSSLIVSSVTRDMTCS
jgi:hypothetical protein